MTSRPAKQVVTLGGGLCVIWGMSIRGLKSWRTSKVMNNEQSVSVISYFTQFPSQQSSEPWKRIKSLPYLPGQSEL